jgi:hypothetical protein
MAGLFGKGLFDKALLDKAKQLAQSEQGEKVTDQVLGSVADIVSKRTGGKHDEQIAKARKVVDEKLGRKDPGSDRK